MLNSLDIRNIENFKLDIIHYIASIVYKTWNLSDKICKTIREGKYEC